MTLDFLELGIMLAAAAAALAMVKLRSSVGEAGVATATDGSTGEGCA